MTETSSSSNRIPVWLDVDTGHDDAFAILLAAHHENIDLIGISTVHGNASLDHTMPNTVSVLQACSRGDVPVIRGEGRPLVREPCFAPEIHGESGLDGVSLLPTPDPERLREVPTGTRHIIDAIMAYPPNTVWIVATGPLTNIAKALVNQSELASHIRGLSIMGGAIGSSYTDAPMHRTDGPGNWNKNAEFNILCDPEAAQYVFSDSELARKTTLITLDLTHQVRGTAAVQEFLFGEDKQSRLRRMMKQVMTFFSETYRVHSGIVDGPPLHDPLAVYAVVKPDMFDDKQGERWRVEVLQDGEFAGQTVLYPAADGKGIRVPRGVNVDTFWAAIDEALARAEQYDENKGM